jgi:hypothetical protein
VASILLFHYRTRAPWVLIGLPFALNWTFRPLDGGVCNRPGMLVKVVNPKIVRDCRSKTRSGGWKREIEEYGYFRRPIDKMGGSLFAD